ncbi:dihydrolipoamide succinyltransferase [Paenibacillus darwinianus]|uniref:Dihydrolipoyllysine-residue succinyltransferase component of 2-oxoglutarate dehydrogenase complex n=1 Tax=Paenibacillus darwinianus TaxID=1380763 RepID=A0A9W5S0F9_9BACL|nr:2-oxoglutarate dehydrogenase complex dihydrolipoyllysine-residue succinyltransferase [Paenibacillus darwinianus]EXX86473.1 dihydrolipoamide succinyltransferase [Paenibacillus darwinianus]EXX86550.1 dihydrolipoamide succinyltransferase [Paenibacillus darwinianus]EXX87548.1 dihydrolipoamide succinyltransferase [Paenibacillus darwinianus]
MADITIPELGESITVGTIAKWLKREGDPVRAGDLLLELETDKVNLEISAETDGVLASVLKREGDTVAVGETVAVIREGGDASASPPAAAASAARTAGEVAAHAGEAVPVAGPDQGKASRPQDIAKREAERQAARSAEENGPVSASPAARRLAREQGIDLERVKGRDPFGRVYSEDVRSYRSMPAEKKPVAGGDRGQASQSGDNGADSGRSVERQRMSRRRLTIAKRLVQAQQTAAMLTTFNEVDMSAIIELRKRRKDSFKEKHDVGLGFMSFFTKAVIGALKAQPLLNAEIDGDEVIIKKFFDIGIAIAAKEGLVVPVVRGADRLSFAEIERRIGELAAKARSNSLKLDDLQGGSFTITNGGVFGSLLSTPILNTPQVGILGMHRIQLRPVAIDEERMENRPMMYIALSYDHQIVDGSKGVRFLVTVKELLEDPEALLLEG